MLRANQLTSYLTDTLGYYYDDDDYYYYYYYYHHQYYHYQYYCYEECVGFTQTPW